MHILAEFYLSCFGYHYKKNRTWNKILLFDVDLILFQVSILLDFFAPFFRYCCFQGPCLDFETWPAPHKWNGQHIGSYLTIKCHCSKWPQWSHPAWHSWPYFGISAIWQTFHGFRCSRRTPLFFFPNIIEKKSKIVDQNENRKNSIFVECIILKLWVEAFLWGFLYVLSTNTEILRSK